MDNRIGIYIHIPYCKNKCEYCNFVSFTDLSTQISYINKLKQEIKVRAEGQIVDTIYIGGGTPSLLPREAIVDIKNCLLGSFDISPSAEFTIEANPESCDDAFLSECARAGVNRLSLGLQSCNDHVLRRAGRLHSFEQFCQAMEKARKHGFSNISADIIIGLEGDTERTFLHSINTLIALSPQHISVYSLKCEQGSKLFNRGFQPDEDLMCDMYEQASTHLQSNGFVRYEVSNFAKPSYQSRHNTKYWQLLPYLGFGVAAHSYYNNIRRANTESLKTYLASQASDFLFKPMPSDTSLNMTAANNSNNLNVHPAKFADPAEPAEPAKPADPAKFADPVFTCEDVSMDEREEFVMLGLRMREGISLVEYERRFGSSLLATHNQAINDLKKSGCIIIENEYLKIHPKHIYVMNQIILALI